MTVQSGCLQLLMFFLLPFTGVNIGGAGSYVYDTPANNNPYPTSVDSGPKPEEKRTFVPKAPSKGKGETRAHIRAVFSLQMLTGKGVNAH